LSDAASLANCRSFEIAIVLSRLDATNEIRQGRERLATQVMVRDRFLRLIRHEGYWF
jgi:hypothetical protein